MKVSKSFIIDSDVSKAFENTRNYYLDLEYEKKSEIKPTILIFKKRSGSLHPTIPGSKDLIVNLKVSFNPVGTLQIYSTSLITVKCDYEIKISGRKVTLNEKKIFENEVEKLKSELVGKIFSKKTPIIKEKIPKNICKEICETAHIQVTFTEPNEIRVGKEVVIDVKIKNIGNIPILLKKIENILSEEFQAISCSYGEIIDDINLDLHRKRLPRLETTELSVTFEPLRSGSFQIKPKIIYILDGGNENSVECQTKLLKVMEAALPDRINTGYVELDNLLFGGFPEKYAIVLTSPSSDEREILIKKFLSTGVKSGELTLFFTLESEIGKNLAEEYQTNFFLFIFNPQASVGHENLPNILSVNGISNLSEINIALKTVLRKISPLKDEPRRVCMEIMSDILLQHKAVTTRRWLRGILSELKSNGFTVLVVINPLMHQPDQVQAILGLFDGEISIFEKESKDGLVNFLRVKRLLNKKYLKKEIKIDLDSLESCE